MKQEETYFVEDEWHYSIMIKYGFQPITKDQIGLVRSYKYLHSDGREIICNTGVNGDHWSSKSGMSGYWSSLENYLSSTN